MQNASNDVVKAVYDVCFDAITRIVLQSDDHSEMQVIFFANLAYLSLFCYANYIIETPLHFIILTRMQQSA